MKKRYAHIVLLSFALFTGCHKNETRMLPSEIEGVWTTDDPRYHDRVLELSRTFVIIITSRTEKASIQWIDKVKADPSEDALTVTVYSTDFPEGTHQEMSFHFSAANGGEIRFKNQATVWKRQITAKNISAIQIPDLLSPLSPPS